GAPGIGPGRRRLLLFRRALRRRAHRCREGLTLPPHRPAARRHREIPRGGWSMLQKRVAIAVIGPLLDGAHASEARGRLELAGAAVAPARGPGEDDIIASCADAEIVMVLGQVPFTERVFASLPRLAFVMQCTVGYDRIDVAAATRHGVV